MVKKFIFLITNNDDPYPVINIDRNTAIAKAQDCVGKQISLEIFGLSKDNHVFNFEKFFRSALSYFTYPDEDAQTFEPISIQENYKQMESVFTVKEIMKRVAFRLLFVMGDTGSQKIEIGVKGFNTIVETKTPSYVLIDPRTNTETYSKTSLIPKTAAESGQPVHELNPEEIGYYFDYGGKKVTFTKDELLKIKMAQEPKLRLLAFRPQSVLKDKLNHKTSMFMIPDESIVTGSSSFFAHLVERMVVKGVVAICSLAVRKNSTLKLVCLLPQVIFYLLARWI